MSAPDTENVRDANSDTQRAPRADWLDKLFGLLMIGVGLVLGAGGYTLVTLGGSSYYLLVGAALLVAGVLLFRRNRGTFIVFFIAYGATIVWSINEAGWAFWPAVPRIGPFLVMAIIMSLFAARYFPSHRWAARGVLLLHLTLCLVGVRSMFVDHEATTANAIPTPGQHQSTQGDWQWRHYGGTEGATHFVPISQVTPENISKLKVAWTFRTGEINDTADLQATPIQVDGSLFFCTARNRIISLDAETGKKNWSFDPRVRTDGSWNRCRGVAFFESPREQGSLNTACARRIVATTIDARMFTVDATTGKLCEGFGKAGFVDLNAGLGATRPGWYYPTSAPLVARDRIIVGGWISDNQSVDEPGGVVRAFDAMTGKMIWAWDAGVTRQAGGHRTGNFTRSTPNFWGTATFDEKLGTVFVPTGSGTSDHWGGMRSAATDAFSTSIVSLDVESGRTVWRYQAVHHDLWDWDLSAPPTFVDMPQADGSTVPALIQVGKSGQIFVLDRRTGRPVTKVVERMVPQGAMPGDHISRTQPYSVGMPQLIPPTLNEKAMWGVTFFDQLFCRIAYRRMNYKGQYTPPSLKETLITPGYLGGMNWGGVAVDPIRKLLLVNDIRLATIVRLVPRDQVKGKVQSNFSHAGYELHAVEGAPYAVELKSFMSPLGLPCEQPPWGKITVIDLKSRQVRWQVAAGTASEQIANIIGLDIPFKLGMPTISGGLMTNSGLAFHAGANDPYIRAWDSASGRLLWESKLPAGSQATPMSYVSPKTGRQFIVVAAGGSPYSKRIKDYVVAYALPRSGSTKAR